MTHSGIKTECNIQIQLLFYGIGASAQHVGTSARKSDGNTE